MKKRVVKLVLLAILVILAACEAGVRSGDAAPEPSSEVRHVVDSVVPMEEALGRFRHGLEKPDGLHGGAAGRDALVKRLVGALAASDTASFEDMAVDMSEWAWLYYPYNELSRPPYELPPGIAWLQLQETNRKGVLRALRELGGHDIDFQGYSCDPTPSMEGVNRIWTDCRITLSRDGAAPVTLPLFGAILERDGRFKILSYQNDF